LGETTTFPSRVVRPDGSVAHVLITSAPRWEDDHVAGSITVVTDVTDQKEQQDALKESEERYRHLVELSPEPIVVHVGFEIAFANASAARLLGAEGPDRLVGRPLHDFVHDESEEAYQVRVAEINRGVEPEQRVAFRLTRLDGESRHVEVASSPVDFRGMPARQILLRDVTEQRQAEHALRDAHEALGRAHSQLAAIIDKSPLVAIQGYSADGRVLFWNRASETLYGFSAEQVVGHRLTGLILDADGGRAFEDLVADICQSKQSAPPREWTTVTASGEQRFVLSSIFPVQVGSNRHATQVVCMDVDITERRRAEEAMRESEAQLRTVVEYAPEAMVILDVDTGSFVEMNENAVRLLGRDREELLRCGPAEVSPTRQPGGRSSVEMSSEMVHAALAGETPVFEWTHLNVDGREIPTEVHLVRLPAAGRRLVRGSITDITERRRLEEQLLQSQKMEAIGRLAGGIAHDFNNLTTAMLGYGEMTLEGMAPDDPFRINVEQMEHAARRAADLTRQLLAFARKQVIEPKVISLNELVRNIEEMLRRLIGEDVELKTELADDLAAVRVDPGQFEQVLVNLAVNGRDAMPGGGHLTVATVNVEPGAWPSAEPPPSGPGRYVAVRVTDTGVGMSHEVLARIFEPFFSTKARTKGTGLGLSTCYGIVKQAGGDILVESDPGIGTTFWIYLPRSDQPAVSLTRPRRETVLAAGVETILLVEDEPMVMGMVEKILRRAGYNVLTAESGEEALEIAADHQGEIDLLLTDVVMPRMSGGNLARILRDRQPGLRVLYMSGYTEDQVGHHGRIEDGAAFLQKPFQARELAERVRTMLDATVEPLTRSES
jgi:PAS domain S-box-containing protein